jgi:RNA recognition motif-containing protein
MKQALTKVFQYYGPILDIIAKSSLKRKGQAFIVFDSEKSALEAVEEMNGFELYGKVLKVNRAKTHSDETVKRKAADMFDEHKRKRLMQKGMLLLPPPLGESADTLQTLSAQKRTPRRKPILPSLLRSLAPRRREPLLCPMNMCDRTRPSSCRTYPAMSTRTISQRYSSDSRVSRKSVWFRSGLWPLPSSRTNSLPLRPRRRQRIHRSVQKASL